MAARPSTPPRETAAGPQTQVTPEKERRIEENRLRAKALRAQRAAEERALAASTSNNSSQQAGSKRSYTSYARDNTPHNRDARSTNAASLSRQASSAPNDGSASSHAPRDDANLQPARKFARSAYIDYDFSAMTDTKGGFLSLEDDPHNKVMQKGHRDDDDMSGPKPAHMTQKEWERHRILQKLRESRSGPFAPGLSAAESREDRAARACGECGALELDWTYLDVFGVKVCAACREKVPEKYSLLTKTEAKADYLLTDPELRDEELLPRLEKPNPHRSNWSVMQLFLRCQVEEYAFGKEKWGSEERLDAEFERREEEKKRRKEKKREERLRELKKRTRLEAYKRSGAGVAGGGGLAAAGAGMARFGDRIKKAGERHEHEWGRTVDGPDGTSIKQCVECGMEVEELEF